jgi:hypothetical protein
MKKQITILAFLLFNCSVTWSQIKITTPCNDELLNNTAGRWIFGGERLHAKISKQQQQEILNRIDKIHQFVITNYPTPLGIDAVWYKATSDVEFAQQVKYDHYPDGSLREDFVNGIPVVNYSYLAKFYKYACGFDRHKDEIMRGYPGEGGASFVVSVNDAGIPHDQGAVGMEIGGRLIRMMFPVKGKWKGYTLYQQQAGSGITMVLLHREGMLPYIPVTRKQYLGLSISYLTKFYDEWTADLVKSEKLAADVGIKPDSSAKEKIEKQKKDVLKYYRDELAATTAAGLLDTPAIITTIMCYPDTNYPIFTPESEGGRMLITENPAYFRKDLPKYTPQCFVLLLERDGSGYTPKNEPIKLMEENFPIEKLQEMIDK